MWKSSACTTELAQSAPKDYKTHSRLYVQNNDFISSVSLMLAARQTLAAVIPV